MDCSAPLLDLTDKVALVTGASRGIGARTALALGKAGAHVILTARTIGGLEEINDKIQQSGGSATILPLDLNDLDSIDLLGPNLYERFQKLDIFISNAAILGGLGPLLHQDAKDWDKVLRINLSANFRLIRSLHPLLEKSHAARAIFLTSGVTKSPRAYWGPYAASKAGLEGLVETYADECANSNIQVKLFDPGRVDTKMRAQAYPGEDKTQLTSPEHTADSILKLIAT